MKKSDLPRLAFNDVDDWLVQRERQISVACRRIHQQKKWTLMNVTNLREKNLIWSRSLFLNNYNRAKLLCKEKYCLGNLRWLFLKIESLDNSNIK